MIRKTIAVAATSAAIILGTAVPAQAAPARQACVEGSRSIDALGAVEVQTVYTDGSRGRAQITLRRLPTANCYWGLLEGPGVIWLERMSWYDNGYKNPDLNLYQRTNKEYDVTHTAATVTTEHSVRACGRAYDGSESKGTNFGASAGASGRTPSGDISVGRSWTDTYEFADGTVCTEWDQAGTIIPTY